jgi:uncharacterized protein YutD
MKIEIENHKYELIKNYKEAFNQEEFTERYTDYFYDYDYIVGEITYGKMRLKGFYDEKNKKVNKINNYKNVNQYLKNNCANDCKHFILKKIV